MILPERVSEADWASAMSLAQDRFGGLDILVNNAGLFLMKSLADTTLDDWRRIHTVNVEGVFLGCRYAAPLLAERASLWAAGGSPNTSCYTASKGAVRLFTKGVAIELASQGIRVNSVHPGVIDTVMGSELVAGFSDRLGVVESDARVAVGGLHPLGRFGRDADVAAAVAFLASDDAAFMTGSEMVVDGGMTAQ
jgi:3(or 17)beta-hydroxysteroid dehydrogenase